MSRYWMDAQGEVTRSGRLHDPGDRPVVVISPEDREQVERLTALVKSHRMGLAVDEGTIAAALRSLIAPPPPEPKWLGAVVEDAGKTRWVRFSLLPGCSWVTQAPNPVYRDFAGIDAVRVVPESELRAVA